MKKLILTIVSLVAFSLIALSCYVIVSTTSSGTTVFLKCYDSVSHSLCWQRQQSGQSGSTTFNDCPNTPVGDSRYVVATQGSKSGTSNCPALVYTVYVTICEGSEPEPDPPPNNE
jgi:hypothetical protein